MPFIRTDRRTVLTVVDAWNECVRAPLRTLITQYLVYLCLLMCSRHPVEKVKVEILSERANPSAIHRCRLLVASSSTYSTWSSIVPGYQW
jgi:hypothetical protein